MLYRARESILAVREDQNGRHKFETISPGTVFDLRNKPTISGLVDVECCGKVLNVFMRDIQERCDKVRSTSASDGSYGR
jgi:hypothetical protein